MTKQAHSLVTIDYTNWRGERRERQVVVCRMIFGSNEWHPEPQWLLLAMDPEDKKEKTFAMSGIHSWNRRSPPPAVEGGSGEQHEAWLNIYKRNGEYIVKALDPTPERAEVRSWMGIDDRIACVRIEFTDPTHRAVPGIQGERNGE